MNWFFHKVYWTGWISHHHRRRRTCRGLRRVIKRRTLIGLGMLGFTSVYRECFEIGIFLQSLRQIYGPGVVLEGVVIGLLFIDAVGVLAFALHQRLPYRRLLIITGVLLLFVLLQVGEEVNEMQLAGWIGTTEYRWLRIPGWMGTWFEPVQQLARRSPPSSSRVVARGRLLLRCAVRACVASSPSRPAGREARRAAARGFRRHRRRRAAAEPLLGLAPVDVGRETHDISRFLAPPRSAPKCESA